MTMLHARVWVCCAACLVSGCTLGTSPLLHYPNATGNLDGYVGVSAPVQPATGRVTVRSTAQSDAPRVTHTLKANTGVLLPEFRDWVAYVSAIVFSLKFLASVGIAERWTLVADISWPRQGLSASYFTRKEGRGGFKLAGGLTGDIVAGEIFGWIGPAWLPAASHGVSFYLGVEAAAGRFHHIFELPPELDGIPDETAPDGPPSVRPHATLMRNELRLRLPLGIALREASLLQRSLAVIPYVTVAHGDVTSTACIRCDGSVTFESLEQRWGIEIQLGARL
jgi:hypothetical protein